MTLKTRTAAVLMVATLLSGLFAQQGDVSAAALTSRVQVEVTGTLTNPIDLQEASAQLATRRINEFANGAGASQADVIWTDRRTVAASTTEDLDFAAGGLGTALGNVVTLAKVRLVFISSASANTQNITLFGDAASIPLLNTAATTVTLQPGGMYLLTAPAAAGVTVTAATGDIIQVANGAGTSVTYDIIVIGTGS